MSKRLMATAYRGYHGLEFQYHALKQMSTATMVNTKLKNDNIRLKHADDMKHLGVQEKAAQGRTERDLKTMRDDFTAQLAYQYAYKNHSFKRMYKSQQQKKPRPHSDKPEMYEFESQKSATFAVPRPLGSLRQMDMYKDELKVKFPPITGENEHINEGNSPRVNMMGEKTYNELKSDTQEDKLHSPTEMTSFPNIEDAMGIQVKFRYMPHEDGRASAITAPPAGIDVESDNESTTVAQNMIAFDMGHNLMIMRQKEKEGREKHKILPSTPNSKTGKPIEGPKESRRRMLPVTPSQQSSIHPRHHRNTMEMKKLLKKDVAAVMAKWDKVSIRKDAVEIAKEHHKATLTDNPIPTFNRSRPTSAILREFREYKRTQEEQLAMRDNDETDQTMIVRQISPQLRAESPVSRVRNEYMHAPRLGTHREGSATHVGRTTGQLHRTESENIPSISRTCSYQDVPEADLLFQENALLTAAERIELERQTRNHDNCVDGTEMGKLQQGKRCLPSTPDVKTLKQLDRSITDIKSRKREPVKMFNTAVLGLDRDTDMINRVKLANLTHEDALKTKIHGRKPPIKGKHERNSYTPIEKHQLTDLLKKGPAPFPADSLSRIKTASTLYGKDLWPKLSKKLNFDYENFSRTTPEVKKRLESRAKHRRKINQKNAQLAEEMKDNSKRAEIVEDVDRPQTRVSFNENVIVFQTI